MERRDQERSPCRTPVRIGYVEGEDLVDDCFWLDSTDVSEDGVFLHTDLLFPVGERLELEFSVPGRAKPVRSAGRVVRVVSDARASGSGVAVKLEGLCEEQRRAMSRMSSDLVRPETSK